MLKIIKCTAICLPAIGIVAGGLFILQQNASQARIEKRAAIIQKMQQAAELTTVVFTIDTIVPIEQSAQFAGVEFGKTKLLYAAQVQVNAGFELTNANVNEELTVLLPPAKIISTAVVPSTSKVQQYDRGFLALGPDVAPELLIKAQEVAITKAREAACDQQILASANAAASPALQAIVSTAQIQTPTTGTCK